MSTSEIVSQDDVLRAVTAAERTSLIIKLWHIEAELKTIQMMMVRDKRLDGPTDEIGEMRRRISEYVTYVKSGMDRVSST